jgi:hypothetical protein
MSGATSVVDIEDMTVCQQFDSMFKEVEEGIRSFKYVRSQSCADLFVDSENYYAHEFIVEYELENEKKNRSFDVNNDEEEESDCEAIYEHEHDQEYEASETDQVSSSFKMCKTKTADPFMDDQATEYSTPTAAVNKSIASKTISSSNITTILEDSPLDTEMIRPGMMNPQQASASSPQDNVTSPLQNILRNAKHMPAPSNKGTPANQNMNVLNLSSMSVGNVGTLQSNMVTASAPAGPTLMPKNSVTPLQQSQPAQQQSVMQLPSMMSQPMNLSTMSLGSVAGANTNGNNATTSNGPNRNTSASQGSDIQQLLNSLGLGDKSRLSHNGIPSGLPPLNLANIPSGLHNQSILNLANLSTMSLNMHDLNLPLMGRGSDDLSMANLSSLNLQNNSTMNLGALNNHNGRNTISNMSVSSPQQQVQNQSTMNLQQQLDAIQQQNGANQQMAQQLNLGGNGVNYALNLVDSNDANYRNMQKMNVRRPKAKETLSKTQMQDLFNTIDAKTLPANPAFNLTPRSSELSTRCPGSARDGPLNTSVNMSSPTLNLSSPQQTAAQGFTPVQMSNIQEINNMGANGNQQTVTNGMNQQMNQYNGMNQYNNNIDFSNGHNNNMNMSMMNNNINMNNMYQGNAAYGGMNNWTGGMNNNWNGMNYNDGSLTPPMSKQRGTGMGGDSNNSRCRYIEAQKKNYIKRKQLAVFHYTLRHARKHMKSLKEANIEMSLEWTFRQLEEKRKVDLKNGVMKLMPTIEDGMTEEQANAERKRVDDLKMAEELTFLKSRINSNGSASCIDFDDDDDNYDYDAVITQSLNITEPKY